MAPTTVRTATISGFKVELLTHSNYNTWKDRARAVLKQTSTGTKTQWSFIKELVTDIAYTKLDEPQKEAEEDAKDFLSLLVSQEVWVEVRHFQTASAIWHHLAAKNDTLEASRQALFEQQLDYLVLDEKKDNAMQEYLNKVTSLVTQIRASGGDISNVTYTGHMLRGLPKSYATVKIICHSKRDDIDSVKNILLGEEARQKGDAIVAKNNNNQSSAHALQAGRGGKDNQKGKGKGDKRVPMCYRCDKEGHTAPYCTAPPKVKETHGGKKPDGPSETKTYSGRDEPRIALMAHGDCHCHSLHSQETEHAEHCLDQSVELRKSAYALNVCLDQGSWYFDSGASDHITGNMAVFDAVTNITPFPITIGDESQCWVTGKGPVTLAVASGREITISEVLYSQSFGNTCLLSVPQLARKGAEIRFKNNTVTVLFSGQIIATGTLCRRSGLYRLDQDSTTSHIYRASTTMPDWHRRFGYTNYRYIRKTQECAKGLEIQGPDRVTCEPCIIGKSTYAHMPPVDEKGGVLYVIYMDHWGPARVQSILGNSYYLLLTDETGFRYIQFSVDRKSFFKQLADFVTLAETQTGKKVRQIRLDNAPEYRSTELKEWAASKGIILQYTTA